jgi:adenylosuccinate synthase
MDIPIVLSGAMFSGKSTLAALLAQKFDYVVVSARAVLQSLSNEPLESRREFQRFGVQLERETNGRWLADAVRSAAAKYSKHPIAVDAARTLAQVRAVQSVLSNARHVHVTAEWDTRRGRFLHALDAIDSALIEEVFEHPIETMAQQLVTDADVVLDSTHCTPDQLLASLVRRTNA